MVFRSSVRGLRQSRRLASAPLKAALCRTLGARMRYYSSTPRSRAGLPWLRRFAPHRLSQVAAHRFSMMSECRRRATSVAPAVRRCPTVRERQAPKARSIPAWGNAPGTELQFSKRAVSPPHSPLWSGLSALPSSRNPYSWGVAPGWYGAGLQPAGKSTVGHPPGAGVLCSSSDSWLLASDFSNPRALA